MITEFTILDDGSVYIKFPPAKIHIVIHDPYIAEAIIHGVEVAYAAGVQTWWLKGLACLLFGMVLGRILS